MERSRVRLDARSVVWIRRRSSTEPRSVLQARHLRFSLAPLLRPAGKRVDPNWRRGSKSLRRRLRASRAPTIAPNLGLSRFPTFWCASSLTSPGRTAPLVPAAKGLTPRLRSRSVWGSVAGSTCGRMWAMERRVDFSRERRMLCGSCAHGFLVDPDWTESREQARQRCSGCWSDWGQGRSRDGSTVQVSSQGRDATERAGGHSRV